MLSDVRHAIKLSGLQTGDKTRYDLAGHSESQTNAAIGILVDSRVNCGGRTDQKKTILGTGVSHLRAAQVELCPAIASFNWLGAMVMDDGSESSAFGSSLR